MSISKIAIVFSALCFTSAAFAGINTKEIKLLNAGSPDKTLQITYKICDSENKNCAPETTISVAGESYSGISDLANQTLHITKVIEIVNGKEIARGSINEKAGVAVFGNDSTLVFNDYNTNVVVYSFGW